MKRPLSLTLAWLNLLLVAAFGGAVALVLAKWPEWLMQNLSQSTWIVVSVVLLAFLLLWGMPLVTLGSAVSDLGRGRCRQGLFSGGSALVLALLPILWMGLGGSFAAREENRVDLAWRDTLEPMDTFTARYPEARASDGALAIESAAALIGVEMNPPGAKGAHPAEPDHNAFEAVRPQLSSFVSGQTDEADETLAAPPKEVSTWLSDHRVGVAALVSQVLRGGPLILETNWSSDARPLPHLLGLRTVQSVLILSAFERQRAGDSRAAFAAIEASWRIGETVRNRGDFISQLVAIGLDGMSLRGLRKLSDVPPSWQGRIAEHDYLTSTLGGFEASAWEMSADVRRLTATDRARPLAARWFWLPVEAPYMRLMASNYSEAVRTVVDELKQIDPCRFDWAAYGAKADASLAKWNLFGRAAMPRLVRAWPSAVRMALEVELTQKVLTARALKGRRAQWPTELTGLDSGVCRGVRWNYEVSVDGRMAITLKMNPSLGKPLAFHAAVLPRE